MYASGTKFPLGELGDFHIPDPIETDIPAHVWEMCLNPPPLEDDQPSEQVIVLVERRAAARASKNWAESDKLRDEIAALGWTVQDSKDGYKLVRNA
jgi:cysteinyl-tRNA synthetase